MSTPKYATLPSLFTIRTLNNDLSGVIQRRLFEHGCRWQDTGVEVYNHTSRPWIHVGSREAKRMTASTGPGALVLTLEELFEIPVLLEEAPVVAPPKVIKHSLPWTVTLDGEEVKIGCQTVLVEQISKIAEEIKEYRAGLGGVLAKPWYIEPITKELSEIIQTKLFAEGYRWNLSLPIESRHTEVDKTVAEVIFSESIEDKTFDAYSIPCPAADREKETRTKLTVDTLFSPGETKKVRLETIEMYLQRDGLKADGRLVSWAQIDEVLAQF